MSANQEIMLVEISNLPTEASAAERVLNDDIARIEKELERYTSKATMEDYYLAVASGALAGAVDVLYVGETPMFGEKAEEARERASERVNRFIQRFHDTGKAEDERPDGPNTDEKKRSNDVRDGIWKVTSKQIPALKSNLARQARHPTPQGFAAAVILRFLKFGTFKGQDGEWQLNPALSTQAGVMKALTAATMTGFINWVVSMSDDASEIDGEKWVHEPIRRLAKLASNVPMLATIAERADSWLDSYVRKMVDSKRAADDEAGVADMFISMAREIAGIPEFQGTGLEDVFDRLGANQEHILSQGFVAMEALGKQAIPVLLNEAIVRMGFFVRRLACALGNGVRLVDIDWAEVVPVGNRTVDRMMAIADVTLSFVDVADALRAADAATRAHQEGNGKLVRFGQEFSAHLNFAGTGKAVVAIVREVSDNVEEARLLREKRLLTETKSALAVERLEEYMARLSEMVDAYLVEDLQAFFAGFSSMDQGLVSGDSDLVIRGNVTIQRVLGHEPQFTNQEEFDDLMGSDDAFIL